MIGLYGAGVLGRQIASCITSDYCFVDDTPSKINTILDGHHILSLQDFISNYGDSTTELFICIYNQGFSYSTLKSRINSVAPNIIIYPFTKLLLTQCSKVLPFLFFEKIETLKSKLLRYESTKNIFLDELSRQTFDNHLKLRLLGDLELVEKTSRQDVPFLKAALLPSVTYIDIGAFDGDTVEDFLSISNKSYSNIYVIEPDSKNLTLAKKNISELGVVENIFFYQKALSSTSGIVGFAFNGSVNSKIDHNSQSKIETLKLSDLNFEGQIYAKLDVEGEEINALKSSRDFLQSKMPILAISVYHNPDDLLDAVDIIRQSSNHYSFYLRCHGFGGSDLMLYAIPT